MFFFDPALARTAAASPRGQGFEVRAPYECDVPGATPHRSARAKHRRNLRRGGVLGHRRDLPPLQRGIYPLRHQQLASNTTGFAESHPVLGRQPRQLGDRLFPHIRQMDRRHFGTAWWHGQNTAGIALFTPAVLRGPAFVFGVPASCRDCRHRIDRFERPCSAAYRALS